MSLVKMKAPENGGGITLGGVPIKHDENGIADIPLQFIGDAKSHGYTEYVMSAGELAALAKAEAKASAEAAAAAKKLAVDEATAVLDAAKKALADAAKADKPAAQQAVDAAQAALDAVK